MVYIEKKQESVFTKKPLVHLFDDTNGSSSPHVLSQQQQPNSTPTTPRTRFQWSNQSNTGVAMTLTPAHARVFMSHYGANSFGVKIEGQNLHESSYLRPQTQPALSFQNVAGPSRPYVPPPMQQQQPQ